MANSEREIRIAVVMYGGTSLAIYMNGISQEFLQLVRATSRAAAPGAALRGTARVYRKLAHVLAGTKIDDITDDVLARPPGVRFVIDILSGTSAGGINSVMLAKALARNTGLEPLKDLWLEEGAIDKLINDGRSAAPRYPYREPVRSLFNSDRMFVELLNAMEQLNHPDEAGAKPLVDDIALVVTGTDLTGDRIDIRLADGVAQEYNHKQTFQFRLSSTVDQFTSEFDPLLAFAARTTSSLPAVFEPSTLPTARELSGRERARRAPWSALFPSLREEDREDHELHAFADGGYLDNKPFGHAIDLLAQAPTGVHVTRKLFYLEPQPQRIDADARPGGTPSALENTLKVFTLARYETIRSDIQRLAERNRLLDRVRTLGMGVLEDLGYRMPTPLEDGADLKDHTKAYGPAYGGYHRLRVATLTDSLAEMLADYARVDPASDLRRAIRLVVRAWRNAHFARDRKGSLTTESEFLARFDVPFQRRRAVFFLTKVNQLFHLDGDVAMELERVAGKGADGEDALPDIGALLADYGRGDPDGQRRAEAAWSGMYDLLGTAKTFAQGAVRALDAAHPTPTDRRPTDPDARDLRETLEAQDAESLDGLRGELQTILGQATGAAAKEAAAGFLERRRALVDDLVRKLEDHQQARIRSADAEMDKLQRLDLPAGLPGDVRAVLERYWRRFLFFDMIQFPLVEATSVGDELSPIEIHRISPADCRHYRAFGDDKLMGTRFASFGAFLDRRWRASDIRWGRLDGAERLITTLLGHEHADARERLIVEAHLAILREEFPADGASIDALVAVREGDQGAALDAPGTKLNTEIYLGQRQVGAELDPRQSATTLSRLLRTSDKLVDTLTTESKAPGLLRNAVGLTSLAGSELLEAAIPKSFKHLLWSYWANLLLLFGGLLIALALVLPRDSIVRADLGLGLFLVFVGLAGLTLRTVAWRLVAPPAVFSKTPAAVLPSRRFGAAALVTFAVVVAANVVLEWPAPGAAQRDLLGHATSAQALQFVRTSGEVACVLGASVSADACVAPAGAPTGAAVDRARELIHVDFVFIALYVALLGLVGLAAVRTSARWLGILGIGLAVAAGALDVLENVRILLTLATDYAQMSEGWLADTSRIARVKFLAVFAAVAALLPTLGLHARTSPLNLRAITWVLTGAGVAGVALGVVGLVVPDPTLLASGLGLLVTVMLGIAVLFMAAHLTVPVGVRSGGEGDGAAGRKSGAGG